MSHEPDDLVPVAARRIAVSPALSLVRVQLRGGLPEVEPRLIIRAGGDRSSFAPLVPHPAAGSDGALTFAFGVPSQVAEQADAWVVEVGPESELPLEPPLLTELGDRRQHPSHNDRTETQDAADARARSDARAREEAAARRRWQDRALAVHAEKEAAVLRLERLAGGGRSGAREVSAADVERLERELERVARDAERAMAVTDELTEALAAANRRADLARLEAEALAKRLDEASAARRAAERRLAEALQGNGGAEWDADLPDSSLSS